MDKKSKVKQLLRSLLLSAKDGIRAQYLQSEYRSLAGLFISRKDSDYSSLQEFIASISDVITAKHDQATGETVYHAIVDESMLRIQKLVSG